MTIKIKFSLYISDFRGATYYGLFIRYIWAFRIVVLVIASAAVCGIYAWLEGTAVSPIIYFAAISALAWVALIFGKAEQTMRQYMRSEGSLLGCIYDVEFTPSRVIFRIPEREEKAEFSIKEFYCVFETSSCFLLYVTEQKVYIVPKRALSEEEMAALRGSFSLKLHERFRTRDNRKFEKKRSRRSGNGR